MRVNYEPESSTRWGTEEEGRGGSGSRKRGVKYVTFPSYECVESSNTDCVGSLHLFCVSTSKSGAPLRVRECWAVDVETFLLEGRISPQSNTNPTN